MKILFINDYQNHCTTGAYVRKELEKSNHQVIPLKHNELNKIKNYNFDVILAVDYGYHYILDLNFHPKAIWLIDTHLSYFCDEVMARSFDLIFVAQKSDAEKLKRKLKNVYWLPLAFDPEWHGKRELSKIYDLAFVGQFGIGKRKKIMELLKKHYPNSYIGPADCQKLGEIYSSAKIGVNYSIKNDINMRIFEILGSGTFLLTNKITNNGFDELFEDGRDLVVYDSIEDLFKKIDYYLKNESEREKIAYGGYLKVKDKHTYQARVKFILEKNRRIKKVLVSKLFQAILHEIKNRTYD